MKLKKIFAGMAASAIAMSLMAVTASAADLSGKAGVEFQTNTSWNFRDWYETGNGDADFPGSKVGVQGGGAFGTADISDTSISGSGDYKVSISANGTVTEVGTASDAAKFWNPVENNTVVTREGSPWSMAGNYKAVYDSSFEGKEDTIEQKDVSWEIDVKTDKFNMLGVTTDIAGEYEEDDDEVVHFYLDSDHTQEVKVSNLSVDMAGTIYTCSDDEIKLKDDLDYLGIAVINAYGESSIDAGAAAPEEGTVTINFHLELVETASGDDGNSGGSGSSTGGSTTGGSTTGGSTTTDSTTSSTTDGDSSAADESSEAAAEDSSSEAADSSSTAEAAVASATADSSSAASSSTSSAASSSTAAASTTTTATTSSAASTTTTTTSSSAAAPAAAEETAESDATENAPAGVPAGVALGFAALAGAVAVVAKKRS